MGDFQVTVYDTERKKDLEEVFGTNTITVKSPIPSRIKIPSGETKLVYFLDFNSITLEQRGKLIDHICAKFDQTREFVDENLEQIGLPILKEQCGLIIHNPQRWVD